MNVILEPFQKSQDALRKGPARDRRATDGRLTRQLWRSKLAQGGKGGLKPPQALRLKIYCVILTRLWPEARRIIGGVYEFQDFAVDICYSDTAHVVQIGLLILVCHG